MHSQGFCVTRGKRMLDCVVSATGHSVLWPGFALVAFYLGLTLPGPMFCRQLRVGKDGRLFFIVKFRSMNDVASAMFHGLTDSRR
jgi:lipopolysaccharide/colanic/teichoic acid biosynthesis glycosyltransferase